MERMFQAILEISLFAIPVILVLALCANLLGKRYGAKWRYLIWLVVAVRLCVPIQLSLPGRMEVMQIQVPSVQSGTRGCLHRERLIISCRRRRMSRYSRQYPLWNGHRR